MGIVHYNAFIKNWSYAIFYIIFSKIFDKSEERVYFGGIRASVGFATGADRALRWGLGCCLEVLQGKDGLQVEQISKGSRWTQVGWDAFLNSRVELHFDNAVFILDDVTSFPFYKLHLWE